VSCRLVSAVAASFLLRHLFQPVKPEFVSPGHVVCRYTPRTTRLSFLTRTFAGQCASTSTRPLAGRTVAARVSCGLDRSRVNYGNLLAHPCILIYFSRTQRIWTGGAAPSSNPLSSSKVYDSAQRSSAPPRTEYNMKQCNIQYNITI
jgi:hypothetical protein